ncbi:MAG: tRNA pseudouridine(55) synthase TruB [Bacteroidota bacterium]
MTVKDVQDGMTIIVDKPLGWTSFDVVNKLRWNLKKKLGVKNVKVGHAGTLDPLATGILVICIGKHTKRIEELMAGKKSYTGTILLGKTTPCFDLEKDFDAVYPTDHITPEKIEQVRMELTGDIDQIPPIFSAKQIDGKRAYDIARSGKEIELKPNRISIDELKLDISRFPEIDFEVTCSKGTYIRALARDIGVKLDSGATLIALRRIRSGDQTISEVRLVDDWIAEIHNMEITS